MLEQESADLAENQVWEASIIAKASEIVRSIRSTMDEIDEDFEDNPPNRESEGTQNRYRRRRDIKAGCKVAITSEILSQEQSVSSQASMTITQWSKEEH